MQEKRTAAITAIVEAADTGLVQATRYVPYTWLLGTGRAVRYHNRAEHGWWLEVQMSGDQGGDRGDRQNKSFFVGFETEQSCKRTGDNLLFKLRKMEHQRRINTDRRYNVIIEAFVKAVKEQIEQENVDVLAKAERAAQRAVAPHVPTLLKDLVAAHPHRVGKIGKS